MNGRAVDHQDHYMPAEWEPHEGPWLQWPHDDTYRGNEMSLEHIWLAMTEALHQHEIVHIVVPDERRGDHLQQQIAYCRSLWKGGEKRPPSTMKKYLCVLWTYPRRTTLELAGHSPSATGE
jgi:hypothetical protein